MSFGDPRRRKPIHNIPLDEIRDNVKNDAVLTHSRSKRKHKLSNSSNEEFLDSESARELHQTFTISSSSQSINRIRRQRSRNQSPEIYNRESYNFDTNDISDDEEDGEDSITDTSNEICSASRVRQRLNSLEFEFRRSGSFKKTPEYKPESLQYSNNARFKKTPEYKPESIRYSNDASKNSSNGNTYFLLALIIGISLLLYAIMNRTNSVDIGTQTEAIDVGSEAAVLNDVEITFKNMKSKYKNQNRDLWLDAYSSIASLINQETKKPSIIVLLGNKSNPLECLARLIGNVSSKALRSDRLVLTPKEFEADMGSVLQTMRSHLKDNKAIIVSDLLNINVEALKAFHNLCDRINPLVGEAIYIITVIADDYDDTSNPLQYIETQLYKKLSGKMKEDAIQPLITRLTDGPILTVKPEPTVTDCSL